MAEDLSTRTVRPVPKDVVGAAEIARLLGVKRQWVHHLARSDPRFPRPWRSLSAGHIWDLRLVLKWAEETGRRPTDGRPWKRGQVVESVLEELRK